MHQHRANFIGFFWLHIEEKSYITQKYVRFSYSTTLCHRISKSKRSAYNMYIDIRFQNCFGNELKLMQILKKSCEIKLYETSDFGPID